MTNDQPVTRADACAAFERIAERSAKADLLRSGEQASTRTTLMTVQSCVMELALQLAVVHAAHRTADGDECVWPTCQGDAMAPHAPADCTCDPNYEPAYTHQPSYDRGWQDAMGATLRAVTDTPAGQVRDDVWQLLWALTYGWAWRSAADKHVKEIRVDDDRFRAIRGACDRLRLWHDNPAAALRTDPGHGDAVKALREVVATGDQIRPFVGGPRTMFDAFCSALDKAGDILARLEAEGRQPDRAALRALRGNRRQQDLISALKRMLIHFGNPRPEEYVDGGDSYQAAKDAVENARDAIARAQAEGRRDG